MQNLKEKKDWIIDLIEVYIIEFRTFLSKIINSEKKEDDLEILLKKSYKEKFKIDDNQVKQIGFDALNRLKGVQKNQEAAEVISQVRPTLSPVFGLFSFFNKRTEPNFVYCSRTNQKSQFLIYGILSSILVLILFSIKKDSFMIGNNNKRNDLASINEHNTRVFDTVDLVMSDYYMRFYEPESTRDFLSQGIIEKISGEKKFELYSDAFVENFFVKKAVCGRFIEGNDIELSFSKDESPIFCKSESTWIYTDKSQIQNGTRLSLYVENNTNNFSDVQGFLGAVPNTTTEWGKWNELLEVDCVISRETSTASKILENLSMCNNFFIREDKKILN